tara:strand:+ start:1278 stop:1595 length:318 start_codon:yes stop_codon:yes gene_type:complete
MGYVPSPELRTGFHANFWTGVGVVVVVMALIFLALMYALDVLFQIPIVEVLFGASMTPEQLRRKPAAVTALIVGVVAVAVAVLLYVYAQGGIGGVGADALQGGPN